MKPIRNYPRLHIDAQPVNAVAQPGGLLLTETIHASGLGQHLGQGLAGWKKPFASHGPSKFLLDLAITLCLGGDALSDASVIRAELALYGRVASNPTITQLIRTLAADTDQVLTAFNQARAAARAHVWVQAGEHAPNHDSTAADPLIIDLDASLITAHSDKEKARPTFKKGYGYHPAAGLHRSRSHWCGEPIAGHLRPGNAGSNTADDHIRLVKDVLAGLPAGRGRQCSFAPTRPVALTASWSS